MAHTLGVECLSVGAFGSFFFFFSEVVFSVMIMVTDQVWAWRSALLIFCLVSLPLFHSFFSILTETHACVYLFFLSQENATIVLRTRITVGNNNSLCQLAGDMAASFNSPPICTSSSDRNTSTCLWQRAAAYTGGRCVTARHQSAQLLHYTRCSRRWGQLLNAMENPWHLEVCIQVHKMGLKSVKKIPAASWIPLVLVCPSE